MRLNYIGSFLAVAAIMAACGKGAKATKQDIVTPDAPTSPKNAEGVFALQGEKKSTSYKSTMLILNPVGNPKLLADVIGVSESTRVTAAKYRAYVVSESKYMPSGSVETELEAQKNELNKFLDDARKELVPVPLAERQENGKGWLTAKLTGLALSTEANDLFKARWNAYCDAKVVELAVHPEFAARSVDGYRQRPSPQQFCEPYYEERGYFKGDSCTKSDYFSCIWIEGVMKSAGESNQAALTPMLDPVFTSAEKTATFRNLLASTKETAGAHIKDQVSSGIRPPTYRLLTDELYTRQHYFSKAMMTDKPSTGSEVVCKQLMLDPTFDFMCGAFARVWNAQPAQNSIKAFESDQAFISSNPAFQTLVDVAKYFGTRPLDGSLRVSNSDFYFHDFVGPQPSEPNPMKLGLSSENFEAINAEFVGKVFPGLTKTNLEKKAQMEQAIKATEDEIAQKRKISKDLAEENNQALQKGIEAATAGDVAFGFIPYVMTVNHYGEIMRVTISFEGFPTQLFEGCYSKDQQRPIDCPVGIGEPGKNDVMHKASLNLVRETGRIDFSFIVEDPDAVGLGYKPKAPGSYFMDLKSEETRGMTLRFELYPNRLENALDILTGKTLFTKDGRDLYEAGISMWEQ